uniref:Molybdopterin biosynthesis protein n=1 Tax=Chondria sp. (in: red algae) TaxID=1982705 RepID=A0A1Z1MER0_9FLOR|nr:Molybdopterin biosynthesis protein [Chondria sp. (in: red algae)]
MFNPKLKAIKLCDQEYVRYSKQLILNKINIEGQKRIKNFKILIIGVGGLGSPTAIYLVTSGIGYIGLIDGDKIEISNLNRQIIYQEREVNTLKVRTAKKKLHEINSRCKIITHTHNLNQSNSKEIIRYYDMVIDTTDNFATRYLINETCYGLNKPYIYGAAEQFIGQVGLFNYQDGINYSNLYPRYLDLKTHNCDLNGVIGISTGYVGILQANEAIKAIIGIKNQLNNKVLFCNLINTELKTKTIYSYKASNNNKIYNKNSVKKLKTTSSENTNRKLQKQIDLFLLVDLKSYNEFKKKRINKSINIPLVAFKLHKTLNFLKKQAEKKKLYITCETLHKSIIVASILENNLIRNYYVIREK